MAGKKKVCIIGGGATGVALLWTLAQDKKAREEWEITLIHNQPQLGGHSLTYPVKHKGKTFNIDIGVQFIAPMLYPNVHEMLKRPEFAARVPLTDYNDLRISAAFPREKGKPMNWGNFPAYQQGENFALYKEAMAEDGRAFLQYVGRSLFGHLGEKLSDFFASPPPAFKHSKHWVNYFLKPYLSIINGYGAALMHETIFGDLFPLFTKFPLPSSWKLPTPLGSFTDPGVGWQRFTRGARSWVQAMAEVAQELDPSIVIHNNCFAQAVWTDPKTRQVTVQWEGSQDKLHEETFDKVVLTTDMWMNSALLQNEKNRWLWSSLYEKYIGYGLKYEGKYSPTGKDWKLPDYIKYSDNPVWDLMWGMCYIHSDSSMLSPDLMDQQETLQFNAYYAPGDTDGNYNLSKTFTTYIQKNVLQDSEAEGLYLTMYGYIPDPKKDKVPDPKKVYFEEPWTHGKWTPAFMSGPKGKLHKAQGLGSISYPHQEDTNIYFAGNNTVADSEEGALVSAIAMAEYAFNVKNPITGFNPLAWFIQHTYRNVMFPGYTAKRIMEFLRPIFYLEVALDTYAALLDLVNPAGYAAQYTHQVVTGMALQLIRWFGDNLVAILLVELVALRSKRNDFLAWVLAPFLVGDIIQLITYANYLINNPGAPLTGGFIFSVVTVVFLAIVRIIWLLAYRNDVKKEKAA